MGELKNQASKSVFWSAVERFSVQGIQLILTIIIARFLLPYDYGLIAMLSIFIALAQTFIDGGFGNALIQKKDKNSSDYSTVFYFNIVISILLYGVLFISTPYIAKFYNEPQLDYVAKVLGIIIIINSFGIVQQSKLIVELNFKAQAQAALIAVIISGIIGIAMAYMGYGVWALVWQTIINNFLRVIFIWIFSKWNPILSFSKESFRALFAFGSKILLSSLLHTIYINIYTLIIGKFFSANICGLYNQANKLSSFASTNMTQVIVRAIYPIQCKYQDDDTMLVNMYYKYLNIACYIIFPIMIVLCALASPLVVLLLGEQWIEVVPLLQILCIAYMWDPVMRICNNMLNVKGRSDLFLKAEIIKKSIAFLILIATIPFGITVMCAGIIAYSFADIIIISHFTKKIIGITFFCQFKSLLPIIILSFIMGIIVYSLTFMISSYIIQLFVGLFVALAFYFGISYIFKYPEFNLLKSLISKTLIHNP